MRLPRLEGVGGTRGPSEGGGGDAGCPASSPDPSEHRPTPCPPTQSAGPSAGAALTRPLHEPVSWSRELGTAAWGRPQWQPPPAEGERDPPGEFIREPGAGELIVEAPLGPREGSRIGGCGGRVKGGGEDGHRITRSQKTVVHQTIPQDPDFCL